MPWHEPRNRDVDIEDLDLSVTVDPSRGTVAGTAILRGTVLRATAMITLNAVELDIRSAAWLDGTKSVPVTIAVANNVIRLRPPQSKVGAKFKLQIVYKATPKQGIYFTGPDKDEPRRPLHVHTQGEAIEARHWIPCPDDPDERLTWTVRATLPAKMVVLSNGEPLGSSRNGKLKTTSFRLEHPHPIYLLTLVAGPLKESVHAHKRVRLSSWSFKKDADRVAHTGRYLPKMLDFFETATRTKYPFRRYGQVYVHEFASGGMENITLTTLTHRAIGDARGDLDRTVDGLLAHELAHQWFGDLVTCRTWGDIWLNESFATYFQKRYTRHHLGPARFAEEMAGAAQSAFGTDNDRYLRPIVSDRYQSPDDLFDSNSYPKGAWVLHMLSHRLGHKTLLDAIGKYLQKHRFQSVETDDLRRALEAESGQSLRGFFQRWVRQAGHPKVTASIRWDSKRKRLVLGFKQTQRVTAQMPSYRLPIEVALRKRGSKVAAIHQVLLDGKRATLTIDAKERPEVVEIDPNMKLMVQWQYKAGPDVLAAAAQFGRHPDVRLRAVVALKRGGLNSGNAIKALLKVLAKDPARHVRAAAAKVLGGARRDQVRAGLLRALEDDKEAPVRRNAAASLGRLHDPAAVKALNDAAKDDKSYAVQSAALRALVVVQGEGARGALKEALSRKSYRHQIKLTALNGLAKLGNPADLDVIKAAAAPGQPKALRQGAAYALATLGARLENKPLRENVRQTLESMLHSPTLRTRHAAARALGALGDPRSRRALDDAAGREQTARWAKRIRSNIKRLGAKMSANARIKKIEEDLHKLLRKGGGEKKGRSEHKSRQ